MVTGRDDDQNALGASIEDRFLDDFIGGTAAETEVDDVAFVFGRENHCLQYGIVAGAALGAEHPIRTKINSRGDTSYPVGGETARSDQAGNVGSVIAAVFDHARRLTGYRIAAADDIKIGMGTAASIYDPDRDACRCYEGRLLKIAADPLHVRPAEREHPDA